MTKTCTKQIGNVKVTILNDGHNVFGYDLFPDNSEDEINALLSKCGKTQIETRFNCCLIESENECILIDAGVGNLFGENAGHINQAFAEIGFNPKSISKVVFTHLHPDHIGGAFHNDGSLVYPNAEIIIDENEYNFWTDPNFAVPALNDWRKLAEQFTTEYDSNITTLNKNGTISPEVSFVELYGHTPGHSGIRVESNGHQFLYVTDLFVVQDVQLQNPSIRLGFDLDQDAGVKVRKKTLDMISTDKIYFSGGHIFGPTIGLLDRHNNGYRVVE